jgi:hypothetical protein
LKRKDFQEIIRLPWAQEAPGSNPGAPTKQLPLKTLGGPNCVGVHVANNVEKLCRAFSMFFDDSFIVEEW